MLACGNGIGLQPDSFKYLSVAEHFAAGDGFRQTSYDGTIVAVHNFPPLYPLLLAAGIRAGMEGTDIALLFALVALAVTISLTGLLAGEGGASAGVAILAALWVALAPDMLQVMSMVLTEAFFVPLTLACMAALMRGLDARPGWLVVAAVCAVLALQTRFIGVVLVATGGVMLCLHGSGRWYRRLTRAATWCTAALLPGAGMAAWQYLHGVTPGARALFSGSVPWPKLYAGAGVISKWLLPVEVPVAVRAVLVAALAGAAVACWRRTGCLLLGPARRLLLLAGLYAIFTVGFLTITIMFADANVSIDHRYLLPVFPPLVATGGALLSPAAPGGAAFRKCLLPLLAVLLCVQGTRAALWTVRSSREGLGLHARYWQEAVTWNVIRGLPAGVTVYSNAPDLLQYYAGRPSRMLPPVFDAGTGQENPVVTQQLGDIGQAVINGQAAVVWLNRIGWRRYFPPELLRRLDTLLAEQVPGQAVAAPGGTIESIVYFHS